MVACPMRRWTTVGAAGVVIADEHVGSPVRWAMHIAPVATAVIASIPPSCRVPIRVPLPRLHMEKKRSMAEVVEGLNAVVESLRGRTTPATHAPQRQMLRSHVVLT